MYVVSSQPAAYTCYVLTGDGSSESFMIGHDHDHSHDHDEHSHTHHGHHHHTPLLLPRRLSAGAGDVINGRTRGVAEGSKQGARGPLEHVPLLPLPGHK